MTDVKLSDEMIKDTYLSISQNNYDTYLENSKYINEIKTVVSELEKTYNELYKLEPEIKYLFHEKVISDCFLSRYLGKTYILSLVIDIYSACKGVFDVKITFIDETVDSGITVASVPKHGRLSLSEIDELAHYMDLKFAFDDRCIEDIRNIPNKYRVYLYTQMIKNKG